MFHAHLVRALADSVQANARKFGDRTAFSDERRSVGFAELAARTACLAGHLASRVGRGERVVLLMGNEVETVEAYLAAVRAGVVAVPVNPLSSDAELAHVLADSGAAAVLAGRGALDRARRMAAGFLVGVEDGGFERLATTEPPTGPRDDLGLDEPAWLLYTSGTTGVPKGVLSTQRAVLWSIAAAYAPILGLSEEDHVLWPLPLFHSLSHVLCVVGVTTVGASARVLADAEPDRVVEALTAERVTLLAGVPAVYHRLIGRATAAPALRAALCTGAVASAELRTAFERFTGVRLVDSYGSTETCGAITMTSPADEVPPGSCGKPVDGLEVRLVDSAGADADEGEVWVRGPNLMLGYHGDIESPLTDGWYRTGDIAARDADGNLFIRGRVKDVVIRGGENLHPAEVEAVLARVPNVVDVGVAGRPHPVLGEVPVAYLVGADIDPASAMAACREALSAYKVPVELLLVDAIPRTRSGKTTRHALAALPSRLLSVEGTAFDFLYRWEGDRVVRAAAGSAALTVAVDRTVVVTGDPDGLAGAVARHFASRHGVRNVEVTSDGVLPEGPVSLVVHTLDTPPADVDCPQVVLVSLDDDVPRGRPGRVVIAYGPWAAEPRFAAPSWLPARALSVEDGLALLDAARSSGESSLVAVDVEFAALHDPHPALRDLVPSAAPVGRAEDLRRRKAWEPGLVLDLVRREIAAVVGRSVAADGEFRSQGLTSVTSVALRARLTAATGVNVSVTAVYDHPTPRALARHLEELLDGVETGVHAVEERAGCQAG